MRAVLARCWAILLAVGGLVLGILLLRPTGQRERRRKAAEADQILKEEQERHQKRHQLILEAEELEARAAESGVARDLVSRNMATAAEVIEAMDDDELEAAWNDYARRKGQTP